VGSPEWRALPNRLAGGEKRADPVPIIKTATGRYLVLEAGTEPAGRTVAYGWVSSSDQRDDLQRQAGRVVTAATATGLTCGACGAVDAGLTLTESLRFPNGTTRQSGMPPMIGR
jgi:hypothetical protein